MGYVPPRPPDLNRHVATLYTLATIMDVGDQFLRQSGRRHFGLPRTYAEYVARLYGHAATDWFMALNYAMLMAMVALVLTLIVFVAHFT